MSFSEIFQPFSSPPHDDHRHRYLYDQDFLDSGCDPNFFLDEDEIEATRVDNTIGTWLTNYIILGVCLIGAFKFFSCMMERIYKRWLWTSLYFLFTGLGYGLAGISHQIQYYKTDPNFSVAAYILTALGNMSVHYQISANLIESLSAEKLWIGYVYTVVSSLIGIAIIVLLAISGEMNYIGGYLGASALWFLLYFCLLKDRIAGVGFMLTLAGLAIQLGLAPTCGSAAYDSCFQDCFLPSPGTFNHNGLFHVMIILALILQLFARFVPKDESKHEEGGEDEVIQPDTDIATA